jgi:hypothetical protein
MNVKLHLKDLREKRKSRSSRDREHGDGEEVTIVAGFHFS